MSVKVRPFKGRKGQWEVDIRVVLPNGDEVRRRHKAPVPSKSGALRWGQQRERALLFDRLPKPRKEVPTLERFAPRFVDGYAKANRQKPSGIASKESILRNHLLPTMGDKRLDAISNEDVQQLKLSLTARAPKTVNNVLTVLNTLLRVAVEWEVIDRMPCTVRLVKTPPTQAAFHDSHDYQRLLEGASKEGSHCYALVLLGGDAGLRLGEMMALDWTDVDLGRQQIQVRRSAWKGHVTAPKGGRSRTVPMTARLVDALRSHRHLRGPRVLCREDGSPVTMKIIQSLVRKAARRAGLAQDGVHVLRHTFCSLLAMQGAPARAIQELAGHRDLKTTQRYMHLSPAAIEGAIRLLEQPAPVVGGGDILETGRTARKNINE